MLLRRRKHACVLPVLVCLAFPFPPSPTLFCLPYPRVVVVVVVVVAAPPAAFASSLTSEISAPTCLLAVAAFAGIRGLVD